jgi:hypothetical protein
MHLRWYIYLYIEFLGVLGGLGGSIIVLVFLGVLASWRLIYSCFSSRLGGKS